MPGQHNNCGKRLPLDNRRSISFAIVIPNLDPVSLAWQQRAASRYSKRPITHHGPMPSVNGLWAACGESVSIIFSSSMRSSCIMFCVPMSSTLIEPDRIKASDNRSQHSLGRQFLRMTAGERSSACQSWVDYTFSDECNMQEVFVFSCKKASHFEAKVSSWLRFSPLSSSKGGGSRRGQTLSFFR